jgi:hypothetical protein
MAAAGGDAAEGGRVIVIGWCTLVALAALGAVAWVIASSSVREVVSLPRSTLGERAAELPIYAVVVAGERLGEVTTNRNRAVAVAREQHAKRKLVEVWEYRATERVKFQ